MEGDQDPAQHREPARAEGTPDLSRLAAAEADLAAVEHAMGRLDDGSWGTCDVCNEPLDPVTLEQRPTERACDAHR
ncbi:MAG: hypothetical protein WD232_01825 [Acidimicrobiales bacterium]